MSEDNYSEKRLINSPFYKDANELRFEISVLNRQLEVARKALHRLSTYDCGFIANNIIATALAEIERVGKESGVNLTVGEEDGKV
jgi:hypothetical protein